MLQEIDVQTFAAAYADGALVIDVREPFEYVGGHVPGAWLIPLAALPHEARRLPRDRTVYVICASGNRSLAAAGWLGQLGVDARSVAGGTTAWTNAGHPVVFGNSENVA